MLQSDLESLKEKITKDYASMKQNKLAEVTALDAEMSQKINELNTQIDAIKVTDQFKAETKEKINQNLMTKSEFDTLSEDKQLFVKDALFDEYARRMNVYHSLSGVEFFLVATFKLMEKIMDETKLSTDELAFYNAFKDIINTHPLTIVDPFTWELQHINGQLQMAVSNRTEYLTKKIEITGGI